MEVAEPLKNLSNLWRILEMLLTYCEMSLILTYLRIVISSATGEIKLAITDTKLFSLLRLYQLKIMQLKKLESKVAMKKKEPYLDYEIDR